jgi:hypothetical protein
MVVSLIKSPLKLCDLIAVPTKCGERDDTPNSNKCA